MKNQVPKDLLFQLRNHIPIDELISHFLNIPCKHSEGHFRFLCPSWNGPY